MNFVETITNDVIIDFDTKYFNIYLKVPNQNIVFIYSVLLCQFCISEETVVL
jgi:hypothetical protein